jgi:hypothetical protein
MKECAIHTFAGWIDVAGLWHEYSEDCAEHPKSGQYTVTVDTIRN